MSDGGPLLMPNPREGADRGAEQLREFDAWLSFRPEFSEVLTAFRDAFGTDTSANAAPAPADVPDQPQGERCGGAGWRFTDRGDGVPVQGPKCPGCPDCKPDYDEMRRENQKGHERVKQAIDAASATCPSSEQGEPTSERVENVVQWAINCEWNLKGEDASAAGFLAHLASANWQVVSNESLTDLEQRLEHAEQQRDQWKRATHGDTDGLVTHEYHLRMLKAVVAERDEARADLTDLEQTQRETDRLLRETAADLHTERQARKEAEERIYTGTCSCKGDHRDPCEVSAMDAARLTQRKPDCHPETWKENALKANDLIGKRRIEGRQFMRERDEARTQLANCQESEARLREALEQCGWARIYKFYSSALNPSSEES